GVGPTGDRLGDVAPGAHAPVGDDVDVAPGLVEIANAGAGGVGDGGGLGDAHAEHAPGGAGGARTDPDQHTHCPGTHQMEGGGVGGAAPDDDGDVTVGDELLEVERFLPGRDVLGGDHGALDDEDVESGSEGQG